MAKTVGISVSEHAAYYSQNKPDSLLVVGDRFDMLGAALPAMLMNIPMIHIQGGEESGSIDNIVRDVISTMSMTHLVSTNRAKENTPENRCRCEKDLPGWMPIGRLYLKFKLAV